MTTNRMLNFSKLRRVLHIAVLFVPAASFCAQEKNLFVDAYIKVLSPGYKDASSKDIYSDFMLGLVSEEKNNFDFTNLKYPYYSELRSYEAWLSGEINSDASIAIVLARQLSSGKISNKASLADWLVRMAPCFEGYDNIRYAEVLEYLMAHELGLVLEATIANHGRFSTLVKKGQRIKGNACEESMRTSDELRKNSFHPVHALAVMDLLASTGEVDDDLPQKVKDNYLILRKKYSSQRAALGPYLDYVDRVLGIKK